MPTRLQPLFLVVDAGGTKTAAAIAGADGTVFGEGVAGGANMAELGLETAVTEILRAVNAAVLATTGAAKDTASASVGSAAPYACPLEFQAAWIGASGCDSDLDVERLTARLAPAFRNGVTVMNDALLLSVLLRLRSQKQESRAPAPEAASASGVNVNVDGNGSGSSTGTPWLAAVVAGTGSIVLGIDGQAGQFGKRGGHGYLFGDVGSAYHLGLVAIRMAADDYDEGTEVPGGLAALLRKRFGVDSTADVPARCHDVPPDMDPVSASNERKLRIAALSPAVLSLSGTCPLAARVVREVARGLATDIASIARAAQKWGHSAARGGLAITGGLGVQPLYVAAVVAELAELGVRFEWVESVEAPARQCAVALGQCHTV